MKEIERGWERWRMLERCGVEGAAGYWGEEL